jgi:AcrR family transcriptional regulator
MLITLSAFDIFGYGKNQNMQYPKEEIKQRILEVAREEFYKNGFSNSSMRTIASRAKMTTGGIYTYFINKEDIFVSLTRDIAGWFMENSHYFALAGLKEDLSLQMEEGKYMANNSCLASILKFADYRRVECELLFLRSEGTCYEGFKSELVRKSLNSTRAILSKIPSGNPSAAYLLSDFFLLQIIKVHLSILTEMLEKKISIEKMLEYEREVSSFFFNGWRGVLTELSYK